MHASLYIYSHTYVYSLAFLRFLRDLVIPDSPASSDSPVHETRLHRLPHSNWMDKEASLGEVCFAANTAISLPFLYNHFHEIAKLFPIEHFTVSSDAKHI